MNRGLDDRSMLYVATSSVAVLNWPAVRQSKKSTPMQDSVRAISRLCAKAIAPLLFALGLAACQSTPPEAQDLGFVQDVMDISAELSEGPERSEQAVEAVEGYRGD